MIEFLTSFLIKPTVVGSLAIAVMISGFYILFSFIQAFPKSRTAKKVQQNNSGLLVELGLEKIYEFFDDILGDKVPNRVKSYVLNLFLVIIISNLFGLIIDILISPFPMLAQKIASPTSDISFTLVLAVTSIVISIIIQAKHQGISSFFVSVDSLPKPISLVLGAFISLLNFIGTIAKVISLTFRLYGNIFAGSILISIIITLIGQISATLLGHQLPLLIPIIFYLQALLNAIIQAFVFSLLTSVFIKLSFGNIK